MHSINMFILPFIIECIYFSTLWLTLRCETNLLDIENMNKNDASSSSSSSSSSSNMKHRIQLHLNDNTSANYLVGNILTGNYMKEYQTGRQYKFLRSMLVPDTYFHLTTQGDLYTRDFIDRDIICHRLDCCHLDYCQVNIEAYLFSTNPTPIKIHITVFIADENDNAPLFPKTNIKSSEGYTIGKYADLSIYELNIPESASIGSRYSLPMATDLDSPRFGIKQYQLQLIDKQTGHDNINTNIHNNDNNNIRRRNKHLSSLESPFTLINGVQSSGGGVASKASVLGSPQLQVDQQLDREEKSIYFYRLIVQDNGQPPLQSAIMLHVKITDVNDNAPKFFNFTMDTTHNVDGSSSSGSIYVMENTTVGTKIFHFHTVDLDEGENGNVTYWIDWNAIYGDLSQQNIQSIVSKYTLNPVNGELRVSSELDYENEYERKVVMLIQAVDNGLPRLTSSLSFTVNLLDINDNDPEIEMQQTQSNTTGYNEGYSQEAGNDLPLLYENNPNSQLLRLLSIKDKDNCSVNKITCQLIDEKENRKNFRLISYSNYAYGLLNQREFDYEKDTNANGNLLAGIQCHDLAEPPKLIKRWFEIPLGDLNDNWPQFNQTNYAFYLYENVPINTQIGQIYATDLDSGINGKLVYELMSDNLELLNLIKIDSKTGILYTSGLLDRELISVLHFLVTVTDCDGGEGGSLAYHNERENSNLKLSIKTNTTSLKIHLLDVNDNPPKYIGPLEIHVEENFPIGTEILNRLNYIDPDLEENSTITVKLLDRSSLYSSSKLQEKYAAFHYDNEGSQSSFITVDNKLRLIVSGPLDRENQAQFILTLIAFDHGKVVSQTSTTTLTIFVDDTNDNEPQLLYPRNASLLFGMSESSGWLNSLSTSTVPADTPFGTLIATIRGKDPDAGENGTVIYSVVPSKVYHLQQQIMKKPTEQHQTGSLDGKYSNRIKNSKSNIKADGKSFENEKFVKIHDGFFYFTIDEQTGQLTTFWGNDMKEAETSTSISRKHSTNSSKSYSGKTSIDKTYDKKNKLTKRLKSRGQPTPGLYLISVNLQDKGVPQHTTEAIFYVNISEPIGDHFGFWTLHDSNMSNTIILILIIVCSLALIISLTAAILWVRFRSDNQMSRPTSNGAYKQGTLITTDPHNPNMNCEFYHSGSLSPVGDIRYEKAYINSNGSTFITPDVVASHSKWNETMFDCCVPTDYTTSGGYCGGTMLTGTLINSTNQKLPGYMQPCYSSEDSNQSAIHLYPIHMSESNDAYNGMTINRNTIDRNEWMSTMGKYCNLHQTVSSATTPLMINSSDAQIPNLVRIDPFVNRIDLCGKNASQMMNIGSTSSNLPNTVILGNHNNNNNNNNNSTGGSDSGVDSGAGIIITTESYLPLSSSSPIKDAGEMKHNVINCNGLLDNSVTPPPLVNGHDHTTTIINTTKNIDDSSINEQYGIITFSPKNTIKPSEQITRQQMHNFPRLNI